MASSNPPPPAPASSSSAQEPSISANPSPPPSRKVPGPWTHEETIHLIDCYQEKWYSLRRGQLKASHWEEVAVNVGHRCGYQTPSKTSTQCRHKIEKLRKRYRTEKQRGFTDGCSWIYFDNMDFMENGPSAAIRVVEPQHHDSDTTENNTNNNNTRSLHRLMGNGGFRVRVASETRPSFRVKSERVEVEEEHHGRAFRNSSSRSGGKRSNGDGGGGGGSGGGGGGGSGGGDDGGQGGPITELASAIRCLGEGFMKLEQMKMEMMRETERMRMDMEMKRTQMVLDSQQRIADIFSKAFYAKKKLKRMASPES